MGIVFSNQEIVQEKTAQVMNTDNNGRATFTVQVGPKSDLGIYDTELEVTKDRLSIKFRTDKLPCSIEILFSIIL